MTDTTARPADIEVVGTIDITPDWDGIAPFHIGVLDGSIKIRPEFRESTKKDARDEIMRMAKLAQLYVNSQKNPVGEMGLPYTQVGMVVQSLARVIVDRDVATFEEVRAALESPDFTEDRFWDSFGGPAVDALSEQLFPGRDY